MKKLALLLFAAVSLAGLSAQQKYALVIGNGAYTSVTRLNNPVNDANDVSAALRSLGFQVDLVLNGSLDQMENGTIRLKNRLSADAGAYGFFFYAGHGIQSGGQNYLIPVDADIKSESFLRTKALQVQAVLDELNAAGNALNMVVLDACRDNPFSWARSGDRGLSVVAAQPADSIIVYATSAGKTAADGEGRNGLFTSHLLKNLRTPGLEVSEVFRRTGADVSRYSSREQIPAIYSQFFGTAYLGGGGEQPKPSPQPGPSPAAPPVRPVPSGFVRVEGGTFQMGSPSWEGERNSNEVPHTVGVSGFYMAKYEVTVGEFRSFVNATGYKTTAETSGGGYVFDRNGSWEEKGDANWKNPYFSQGEGHPVTLVSWYDAVQYCNWRSSQEGLRAAYRVSGTSVSWDRSANGYRLPTEAEWEYACRAGTSTRFSTGGTEESLSGYANGADLTAKGKYSGWTVMNIQDGYAETAPVGTFKPNGFGLYDMHGNVWEWCWDWYGDYSGDTQTDPAGPASGSHRVLRGGSWGSLAQYLRSADRSYNGPSLRHNSGGFRLVRALLP
jgi:formylglycine-generating enzyme required for sulfatase activity